MLRRWQRLGQVGSAAAGSSSHTFLAALSSEHFPSETHVPLSAPLRLSYAGLPALLREAVWPHRHRLERRAWRGFCSQTDSLLGNLFSQQWAGDFGAREGGSSSKAKPRGLTLTQHLRGLSGDHSVGILHRPC